MPCTRLNPRGALSTGRDGINAAAPEVVFVFALCCLWLLLLSGGCAPSPVAPAPTVPGLSGAPPPACDRAVRLVFTGDIMTHAEQLNIARQADGSYDFSGQFAPVLPLLQGDLLVGNFETVLAGPRRPYTGYPSFNTPDSLADALRKAGFDVLLLANNHILDLGAQAALRTKQVLTDKGFAVTGLGPGQAGHTPPLLCEVNGLRLGILNYTYGSNRPVTPALEREIALNGMDLLLITWDVLALRAAGAQYIVAAMHWGIEYRPEPSPAQRAVAAHCLALGVDAIIGAHPHILQPVELHAGYGKPQLVAWSLGNFISAQRTVPRERAMILALDLTCSPGGVPRLRRVSLSPTWVELSPARKRARILPTAPGLLPDDASEEIRTTVRRVHADCLNFLGVLPVPDARGFYTIYEAPPPVTDWLPGRSARLMRFFLPDAWLRQAVMRSRLRPPSVAGKITAPAVPLSDKKRPRPDSTANAS